MGAAGVAAATVLCYTASSAFLFVRLLHADEPIRIERSRLHANRNSVSAILRIGVPAGIQGSFFSLASILIQTCINSLGTQVVAASSAALSLEFVCYYLFNSFSQACTTFVGQNSGAHNPARCKEVLKVALIEDSIFAVAMIALVVWQGRTILTLFSSDADVLDIAYVRICTLFPAYAFSMAYENMSGYLRGFGISALPSALTAIGVCGTRFFWALAVFPVHPTFATVMVAYPVSFAPRHCSSPVHLSTASPRNKLCAPRPPRRNTKWGDLSPVKAARTQSSNLSGSHVGHMIYATLPKSKQYFGFASSS